MDFTTTYDNTQVPSQGFREATGIIEFIKLQRRQGSRYHPGVCRWCYALTTSIHKLKRCKGCQLVAYCGKECQENDWRNHKVLCNEFPVKDGKSILVVAQEMTISNKQSKVASVKEVRAHYNFMYKLVEKVKKMQLDPSVFLHPRICKLCCEARPDKLFDCVCCEEVYCSQLHRNKHKSHLERCEKILSYHTNRAILSKKLSVVTLPGILREKIHIGNKPVDYKHLDDLRLKLVEQLILERSNDISMNNPIILELLNIIVNRLSYPLTILNILQRLGVGGERKPLRQVTSLNIHVLSHKLFVDSSIWEYFMHMIPNLKELHVTLVGHIFENNDWYMKDIKLKRCKECEKTGRIIKYTIYKNHYHIFSSSHQFTTPDVIAVFGSYVANLIPNDNHIPALNWQSVTKSTKTTLIFTDEDMEALQKGIEQVKLAFDNDSDYDKTLDKIMQESTGFVEKNRVLKNVLAIHENPVINTSIEGAQFLNNSKYICCYQSKHASSLYYGDLLI